MQYVCSRFGCVSACITRQPPLSYFAMNGSLIQTCFRRQQISDRALSNLPKRRRGPLCPKRKSPPQRRETTKQKRIPPINNSRNYRYCTFRERYYSKIENQVGGLHNPQKKNLFRLFAAAFGIRLLFGTRFLQR